MSGPVHPFSLLVTRYSLLNVALILRQCRCITIPVVLEEKYGCEDAPRVLDCLRDYDNCTDANGAWGRRRRGKGPWYIWPHRKSFSVSGRCWTNSPHGRSIRRASS